MPMHISRIELSSFAMSRHTTWDQKSGMLLDLVEYSETSFINMEDLSSNSRAGVSNSATRPANHLHD